tara:strand:+ start:30 stop:170 length:141 start_codon:yes stop_codon:yes gene_type:complete
MWEALSSTFFNVCGDDGADACGHEVDVVLGAFLLRDETEHNDEDSG